MGPLGTPPGPWSLRSFARTARPPRQVLRGRRRQGLGRHRRARRGPWALLSVLTTVLVGLGAGPALAHTYVVASQPGNGARLAVAPSEVIMAFDEPPEWTPTAFRLLTANGGELPVTSRLLDDLTVAVSMPVLDAGSYLVTHRLVADDGHVARGAVLFIVDPSVGGDSADANATMARGELVPGRALDLAAEDGALPVLSGVLRWVTTAGILLVAGALAWLIAADRAGDRDEVRRARRWIVRGADPVAVAGLLTLPVNAMLATGDGVAVLTSLRGWDPLTSPVALAASLRIALAVGVVLAVSRGPRALAGLLGTGLMATLLVDGHSRTADPFWLVNLADFVHVAAASVWLGGLVVVVDAIRARRVEADPVGAAVAVSRFSGLAAAAVAAAAVSGSLLAVAMNGGIVDTESPYGSVLLVKVAIVVLVLGLGWFNRRQLVPMIERATLPVAAGGSVEPTAPVPVQTHDPHLRGRAELLEPERDADGPASFATPPSIDAAWWALRLTVAAELALLVVVSAVTAYLVDVDPGAGPGPTSAVATSTLPPSFTGGDAGEGSSPLTGPQGAWTTGELRGSALDALDEPTTTAGGERFVDGSDRVVVNDRGLVITATLAPGVPGEQQVTIQVTDAEGSEVTDVGLGPISLVAAGEPHGLVGGDLHQVGAATWTFGLSEGIVIRPGVHHLSIDVVTGDVTVRATVAVWIEPA